MRAALHIAFKEIRQRLRDRSAYVTAVVAPLGLALILGGIFGGDDEGGAGWELAVVDEDGGEFSAAFVEMLRAAERNGDVILTLTDRPGVDALIEGEDYPGAFVFPAGFSEAIPTGRPTDIIVVANPEEPWVGEVLEAIARDFADGIGAVQLSVGTAVTASGVEPGPEVVDALVAQSLAMEPPVTLTLAQGDFSDYDIASYFAAGMTVFFLFFIVQSGILSLMREREQGTLARLLVAPVRPASVLLGKALASVVLGLATVTVMVIATTQVIGAEWGDPVGVALLAVAGVLVAVGLVILIASIAKTEKAARSYTELVAVVLGLLGGSFFIIGQASGLVAQLTWLSPHRWLLEGFLDLNAGDSAAEILRYVGGALAFAVVTAAIGLLRSHRLVRLS